jgi:radical SAM superfamily enzyme YgiQ (UPF0313 family)
MKISLIYPPNNIPYDPHSLPHRLSNFFNFLFKGKIEASNTSPLLGILYLATILKEHEYEVSVLDSAVKGYSIDDTVRWVKKENPDIVGISMMIQNFLSGIETAKEIKENFETKIIVGGPHPTFVFNETLKEYPFIDIVVRGEAEETILDIVSAFQGRKKLKDINGISFINKKKIVNNPPRAIPLNLDKIPFPDRSFIKEGYTANLSGINFAAGKFTAVITSRGCPFGCTFCSATAFRKKICSFRSPENVVDEIELLVGQGYEEIGFVDDNFMLNRLRVEKICELIKKRRLKFYWWCEGRVDSVDYDILKMMKSVGCESIYFGIESANQHVLEYYKKHITAQQTIKAVNVSRKANLNVIGGFIVGAPVETKRDVMNTLDFARKLDIDVAQFSILGVHPGADLWKEMVGENPSLGKYWKQGFTPVELNMCQFTKEWIDEMIVKTIKKFVFNADYMTKQAIKCFTDPYRLKMIRRMVSL